MITDPGIYDLPAAAYHAMPMRRFLASQRDVSRCWLWQGSINKSGYGLTKVGRKTAVAHRVAHWLAHGPIKSNQVICHRCDQPICCNPSHLFAGTQKDNIADCIAKGRFVYGERNGQAKLTDIQVRAIRASLIGQVATAKAFGVSQALVSGIQRREKWRHVSD